MKVEVVIAGGGRGKRFGDNQPKQFCLIAGRPILDWTLDRFEVCPLIDGIILVVPQGMQEEARGKLSLFRYKKLKAVVEGGEERIDSVFQGLTWVDRGTEIVLVHDGVRPLVSCSLIESVIQKTKVFGAVVPAVPVKETLKQGDEDNLVLRTLPRDRVYLIQTPQGFKSELIKTAHQQAKSHRWRGSDDAILVEKMGSPVQIIPGEESNIKITTSFDFQIAEILLKQRECAV